jgi:predicted phosphodiesterase
MRIAIISDIHSNLHAFTKALALIKELGADTIYCLGDIVGYGSHPNECIDLIREKSSLCVIGNHDNALLNSAQIQYLPPEGQIAAVWTQNILTQENRKFLSQLNYKCELNIATLVHANPKDPENWSYVMNLEEAALQFQYFSTRVCFIGHSHIPSVCGEDLKTFQITKYNNIRFLINVGSIGQPRDGNPQLSFGLLDTDTWTYKNIRSEYDVSAAAQSILDNNLPQSLATRLLYGI